MIARAYRLALAVALPLSLCASMEPAAADAPTNASNHTVVIDGVRFEPGAYREGRRYGDVDQQGSVPAYRNLAVGRLRLERNRTRAIVAIYGHEARRISLPLLAPSHDEGNADGPIGHWRAGSRGERADATSPSEFGYASTPLRRFDRDGSTGSNPTDSLPDGGL